MKDSQMFNFFSRKTLPITKDEQHWIDYSLIWLMQQFGTSPFLNEETLTPLSEPYVNRLNSTSDLAEALLKLVCDRMGVDVYDIELIPQEVEDDSFTFAGAGFQSSSGAAGLFQFITYNHFRISYDTRLLNSPASLLTVLAHEVGHVILLRDGSMSGTEEDHELMTDLIALYYGFGIFAANSMLQESHSSSGWSSKRVGYLSMPMYSYALASLSRMKNGGTLPEWQQHLRLNARTWFKRSLHYLEKTGDTSLITIGGKFCEDRVPSERVLLKKQLTLAILLEEYEYVSAMKSFLELPENKLLYFPPHNQKR